MVQKPYFLPWMGYFAKLAQAAVFVVQDNVLASNRVWINRIQVIRSDGEPQWLSLPIGRKGDAVIADIQIQEAHREASTKCIRKTIEQAYARSRYFKEWQVLATPILAAIQRQSSLVLLDLEVINILLDYLHIPRPQVCLASSLVSREVHADPLLTYCEDLNCDSILLGPGNTAWRDDDTRRLEAAGITPLFQDFFSSHPRYYQTRRKQLDFLPGLSIIDCILNEGPDETVRLMKSVPFDVTKPLVRL